MSAAAQQFEATVFDAGGFRSAVAQEPGRISARAAYQELLRNEARLVDVRSELARRRDGRLHPIFQPLVIDRHLVEWRLDPRSETSLPGASYDARVLVISGAGHSSVDIADDLRQLGLHRCVDVVGGFADWLTAGLPAIGPEVSSQSSVAARVSEMLLMQ